MWNEIQNETELKRFLDRMQQFHDSCLKELRYTSGAYVDERLSMHPLNDVRTLTVVIQRQFRDPTTIEMEFRGLRFLRLRPVDEAYTCEILDASMFLHEGCIYWCDCGGVSEADVGQYDGTVICADSLRWRPLD